MSNRTLTRIYVLALPFLAALAALVATMTLSGALITRERVQLRLRTDAEAKHVAAQLRSAVLQSVDLIRPMAAWWLSQGRPTSREDWESDAKLFLSKEASLRDMEWVDSTGNVTWTVQPGSQPDFHKRPPDPQVAALVRQAAAAGGLVLSPLTAVHGEPRFYACMPVARGRRIEFIAAGFDAHTLITALLSDQAPPDYVLNIGADGLTVASMQHARFPVWRDGSRTAAVNIANHVWTVQLLPAATDIQTLQRLIWSLGIIVSVLLYLCTGLALIYKKKASALRVEVAERRRAEQKIAHLNVDLHHQVADFQTLLDVLPVGIAVSNDPECREIWMNPRLASMMHMRVGQNISLSAPDADKLPYKVVRNGAEVPPDQLPMQTAARTRKSVLDMDIDIVRQDGSVLNSLSYAAPVFDEDGTLLRVINACIDITDRRNSEQKRKVLEERLLRAEKYRSLGLMAGGIAHDFNNLLTAIIGFSEMAQAELPPFSSPRSAIAEVLAASRRAAGLVSQLLAYTGSCLFELKPIDLSAEIQSGWELIRETAPPHVNVCFDLAAGLPTIVAGANEVREVLRNLIENAVEAIGEKTGTICVRTRSCTLQTVDLIRDYPDQELHPGTYVQLEVADNGSGVPRELAARVFDPFFTTKFMGRGLGLSAVQGIMHAHNGAVRFNTSVARGACVQAIFPVEKETA